MRRLIFLLVLISAFTFIITADAVDTNQIQATKVEYPILIDGKAMPENIYKIVIDDRVFLPLRAMCEHLNMEVEWNETERAVEIKTQNEYDINNELGGEIKI